LTALLLILKMCSTSINGNIIKALKFKLFYISGVTIITNHLFSHIYPAERVMAHLLVVEYAH